MTQSRLVTLYAVFAVLSICANVAAQKGMLIATSFPYGIPVSVFVGTAVGLGVKFVLDKIWIFKFRHRGIAHGAGSFVLYCAMGIVTTLTFWLFEFGAAYLTGSEKGRLAGAVIGLTIGYVVKYHLDRTFVFK
jgi:putative flippase GtrA